MIQAVLLNAGPLGLAAQATALGVADFAIATINVDHLSRFVTAKLWQAITID